MKMANKYSNTPVTPPTDFTLNAAKIGFKEKKIVLFVEKTFLLIKKNSLLLSISKKKKE
jgi:hypothetical protein